MEFSIYQLIQLGSTLLLLAAFAWKLDKRISIIEHTTDSILERLNDRTKSINQRIDEKVAERERICNMKHTEK